MLATMDRYVEFDDDVVVLVPGRRASSEPPPRRADEMSEMQKYWPFLEEEEEEEPPISLKPQPQQSGFEDGSSEVWGGTSLDYEEEPSSDMLQVVRPQLENNRTKRQTSKTIQWWQASTDICPLSHFPINLLPYPPFELRLDEGVVLIDGQFLVYTILSTWKFKVLGMQFADADIQRLDSYMKKCKLGTLRIGVGIALKNANKAEEFVTMKRLAKDRLRRLTRIKRNRLARLTHQNDVQPHGGDQTSLERSSHIQCNYWNTNVYDSQMNFPCHENLQFYSWPASSMQALVAMQHE